MSLRLLAEAEVISALVLLTGTRVAVLPHQLLPLVVVEEEEDNPRLGVEAAVATSRLPPSLFSARTISPRSLPRARLALL